MSFSDRKAAEVHPWAEAVIAAMAEVGCDMYVGVEFYPFLRYTISITPYTQEFWNYHFVALALCESLRPEWLPLSPMANWRIHGIPLPHRRE